MINRCVENMELLNTMPKEGFYYQYLEVPMKADDNGLNLYVSECRKKILQPLMTPVSISPTTLCMYGGRKLQQSLPRHQ